MPEVTPAVDTRGKCFVVMGFGKKTDFETGRTLDLDKTYKYIIKPAVADAGLKCVRADEIPHSGVIDVPMYEELLTADVVIADISTSNKNAFYELGVRHALRPYTTIVICEDGAKSFPFDINHILIRQYHHMGEGIDFGEVERFRGDLTKAIRDILEQEPRPKDSPVYTFLNDLNPPALAEAMKAVAEEVAKAAPVVEAAAQASGVVYSELMEQVDEAQREGDYVTAKALLTRLRRKMKEAAEKEARRVAEESGQEARQGPEDPYLIQRLALVTYKGQQPDARAALEEARDLLLSLNPATSNDTETLGLWGAVHKRLWYETHDVTHLDEAVRGLERGFYLRNDYYNGINLAFLLNVRAAHAATPAEAVADFILAGRIRREVLAICECELDDEGLPEDYKYWLLATKAEALLGLGETEQAELAYAEAYAAAPARPMVESTKEQRAKLEPLLADSPLKYVKAGAA